MLCLTVRILGLVFTGSY